MSRMLTKNEIAMLVDAIEMGSAWAIDQAETEKDELVFYRWNRVEDCEEYLTLRARIEDLP